MDGSRGEMDILRSCYEESLHLADKLKCKSVAFPLIATGIYGFPKDEALSIALSAIGRFLLTHEMKVVLVVFDTQALELSQRLVGGIEQYIDEHAADQLREAEYGGAYAQKFRRRRQREPERAGERTEPEAARGEEEAEEAPSSVTSLPDIAGKNLMYYRVILGRDTYSQIRGTDPNKAVMYADNACKHLSTTDSILDEPAKVQLRKIGIYVDNIYDFLRVAFYRMDEWLVNYSPCDLFDKKIGSLDSIMGSLVYNINKKLFGLVNAKEAELKKNTVRSYIKKCSQMENWVTTNPVFRSNPAFCNDNELITILSKRFRSLENVETAGSKANKKTKVMTNSLLKAHPSHLIVESIVSLPESAPVVTGEINPYLIIDDNGQIIKPDWAPELDHIFD